MFCVAYWVNMPSFNIANGCTYNVCNVLDLRLGSTSIGHARHVKTRNDNGLRIWIFLQKLPFSVGKKCFNDKFRKYNTLYLCHITNISDFVWFRRSCGSMKSVSSFSIIDMSLKRAGNTMNNYMGLSVHGRII